MLTPLIVVAVCLFLFGFAGHNQPSRDLERPENSRNNSDRFDTQPSPANEGSPTCGNTADLNSTDPARTP